MTQRGDKSGGGFGEWLRTWRVSVASVVVIIASAVLGLLPAIQADWHHLQKWLPSAIVAGVVAIAGVCNIIWDKKRIHLDSEFAVLTEERDRVKSAYADLNQAHKELAQRWIQIEFARMQMNALDRLSLFVLSRKGDCFWLCARYSGHGEWRQIRTIEYPLQGSIYVALQQGQDDSGELPDPDTNPRHYTKSLEERYNFRARAIRGSRMKARRIQSWRLDDRDGVPIAVLTAESKDPQRPFFSIGEDAGVTVRACGSDEMLPIIQRCIGSIRNHDERASGISPAIIEEV